LETRDDKRVKIVGVRFQPVGKVYDFDAGEYQDLGVGDFVIVRTSRGKQLGWVANVGVVEDNEKRALKPIERLATGRDLAIRQHWERKEREALETARKLNAEVGLAIKLVKAEYSFDGKRLTILYSAEDRRETKPLRQRLSRSFRARVELRQIGPRDVAKVLGDYGACGEPRCCSTFLSKFNPISIRMAKAQSVSLSPSEITGMCGRLRCCLIYEYEQYLQARKKLPKHGKQVGTPFGQGKVVSLMPLKDVALVDLGERRVEIQSEDIMPLAEWRALQEEQAAQEAERKRQEQKRPKRRSQKAAPRSRRSSSRRSRSKKKNAEPKEPPAAGQEQDKPKSARRRRRRR
jgi:cell fate regulator YaaT (PSP1 superfamily)